MEIEFYEKADGSRPAEEFILEQSSKMRAKIATVINYLKEEGTNLRMPYSEKISGEIFQLRAQTEGDNARVLYFFVVDDKAVLTHGFIKKTQKTPRKEIQKAKDIREEYLKRQKSKKEGEKNG